MAILKANNKEYSLSENIAIRMCTFAYGSCACAKRKGDLCDATARAANDLIKYINEELIKKRSK